ncbi:hypothetical protein IQ06DRAFT_134959 [Phaeosphaeriaceae sp. SRC1lsM3a]|nr:hypothetical protein IQ06DRAFT_134959 [Stagonospora sp. SRC1lsM3a]
MLWMESTTSKPNGSGKSKASSHVSFEKTAAGDVKEVRKFVVIANKGVYSKCIKEARLNYSKHMSVEHDVKVVDIGMVVEKHRYMLGLYFEAAMRQG